MKKINIFLSIVVLIGLFSGCKKDLLDIPPTNAVVDINYYKKSDDAHRAIMAAYSAMQNRPFHGNYYPVVVDVPSDDYTADIGKVPDWAQIDVFKYNNNFSYYNSLWHVLYAGVFRCNIALEKIPAIDFPATDTTKSRLLAEAKFLRATYYWYLTTLWGDVPLILTSNYDNEAVIYPSRVSRNLIYDQIFSDLKAAYPILLDKYDNANLGRATKGAALAMLGKAYLYRQDWANAELYLAMVKNLNTYSLMPNYGDIFLPSRENNSESVFEVQYKNIGGNTFGNDFDIAGENHLRDYDMNIEDAGNANFIVTSNFVNEFTETDPVNPNNKIVDSIRLETSVYSPRDTVQNNDGTLFIFTPAKFSVYGYRPKKALVPRVRNNKSAPVLGENNVRIIRYADVLLMLAEAINEQGRFDEAEQYLNQVRTRVKLPSRDAQSADEMRTFIIHERRLELGLEQHRFFDLVRWGIAPQVLQANGFIEGVHELLPIPQLERDKNPNITQNPGY